MRRSIVLNPACDSHPSTCRRADPVNGGPWAYWKRPWQLSPRDFDGRPPGFWCGPLTHAGRILSLSKTVYLCNSILDRQIVVHSSRKTRSSHGRQIRSRRTSVCISNLHAGVTSSDPRRYFSLTGERYGWLVPSTFGRKFFPTTARVDHCSIAQERKSLEWRLTCMGHRGKRGSSGRRGNDMTGYF